MDLSIRDKHNPNVEPQSVQGGGYRKAAIGTGIAALGILALGGIAVLNQRFAFIPVSPLVNRITMYVAFSAGGVIFLGSAIVFTRSFSHSKQDRKEMGLPSHSSRGPVVQPPLTSQREDVLPLESSQKPVDHPPTRPVTSTPCVHGQIIQKIIDAIPMVSPLIGELKILDARLDELTRALENALSLGAMEQVYDAARGVNTRINEIQLGISNTYVEVNLSYLEKNCNSSEPGNLSRLKADHKPFLDSLASLNQDIQNLRSKFDRLFERYRNLRAQCYEREKVAMDRRGANILTLVSNIAVLKIKIIPILQLNLRAISTEFLSKLQEHLDKVNSRFDLADTQIHLIDSILTKFNTKLDNRELTEESVKAYYEALCQQGDSVAVLKHTCDLMALAKLS